MGDVVGKIHVKSQEEKVPQDIDGEVTQQKVSRVIAKSLESIPFARRMTVRHNRLRPSSDDRTMTERSFKLHLIIDPSCNSNCASRWTTRYLVSVTLIDMQTI